MRPASLHIAAAYTIAAFLFLSPLSEAFIGVWPMAPGSAMWRFTAFTVLSRSLLTPMLGFLVLTGLAVYGGGQLVLRITGVIAILLSLFLLAGSVLFVLDALQMRPQVLQENRSAYDMANAQALLKLVVAGVAAGLIGAGSIGSSRLVPVARRRAPEPTLVRTADSRPG